MVMDSVDSFNMFSTYSLPSILANIEDKEDIVSDANNNSITVEEKLKVDRKKFESLLEGTGMTFDAFDINYQ